MQTDRPRVSPLAVLIGLLLALNGCMKAVEKATVPPTPPPAPPALTAPYDADLPETFRGRWLSLGADHPLMPALHLAVASHFQRTGEGEKAIRYLEKAARGFGDRRAAAGEAMALIRQVAYRWEQGQEKEALAGLQGLEARWPEPPLKAFPDYLKGRLALLRGDFTGAAVWLDRALDANPAFRADPCLLQLRRDTELAAGQADLLNHRIPRLAAADGSPGIRAASEGDGPGVSRLLSALALTEELRRSPYGALAEAAEDWRAASDAEAFLGWEAGMTGRREEGLARLTRAMQLARDAGDPEGEMRALALVAELGLDGQNTDEGRRAAEALQEQADARSTPSYRIWARLLLARYDRREGQADKALAALREAETLLGEGRVPSGAALLAPLWGMQRRAVDEALVEALADSGRAAEALAVAERAKAGALAELLAGRPVGADPSVQALLGQERAVAEELRLLERQLLRIAEGPRLRDLRDRQKATMETLRGLLAGAAREAPREAALLFPSLPDPGALQALLDEDTTLFLYYAATRALYCWAIHRQALHLERIALPREELRRLVLDFREALQRREKRRSDQLARRAYDLLLKPVIPFVSGERIGFVPDDSLRYLPFAALNYRGRYLVEGFSLFTLPAAQWLREAVTQEPPPGMRILAFGNPDLEDETLDLHHAVDEVALIQKRIGQTTALLGPRATEARALELGDDYDILHFAVRVRHDPEDPLRSALLLTAGEGRDGALQLADLFQWRYHRGRAVVLSGSEARPQEDPLGRGPAALSLAFLQAGSSSVISTLWLLDDRQAGRLLDQFYFQLNRKASPAAALRLAQLKLLKEGIPAYVWGAFTLAGRF